MMNNVFNTTYEMSLRVILLLYAFDKPQTLDMLYAADFITTYGAEFGISKSNLNGDNIYKFSEISNRRELVRNAIKKLVLSGMAKADQMNKGFLFIITNEGKAYCQSLNSNYALQYSKIAKDVVNFVSNKSERVVISYINEQATKSLKRGAEV